ncbi:hypothetical protein A2U01_0057217, partial [Trifolium medium]|nr:hypothetical protein [Trifolium medium]
LHATCCAAQNHVFWFWRFAQLHVARCAAQNHVFWFWRVAQLWSRVALFKARTSGLGALRSPSARVAQ